MWVDSIFLFMFNWRRDNSLNLIVKKTKEMLIDFIDGMKVERVTEYKYLGTGWQQAEF